MGQENTTKIKYPKKTPFQSASRLARHLCGQLRHPTTRPRCQQPPIHPPSTSYMGLPTLGSLAPPPPQGPFSPPFPPPTPRPARRRAHPRKATHQTYPSSPRTSPNHPHTPPQASSNTPGLTPPPPSPSPSGPPLAPFQSASRLARHLCGQLRHPTTRPRCQQPPPHPPSTSYMGLPTLGSLAPPPPRVPSAPPVYPPPPDQPNAGHILAKPRIRPTHQASGHRPITPKHPHRHPQTPLAIPPPHPLPHLQGPLLPPSSPPLASPDTSADSSDTPLHAPGASNHPLTHPRPLL